MCGIALILTLYPFLLGYILYHNADVSPRVERIVLIGYAVLLDHLDGLTVLVNVVAHADLCRLAQADNVSVFFVGEALQQPDQIIEIIHNIRSNASALFNERVIFTNLFILIL